MAKSKRVQQVMLTMLSSTLPGEVVAARDALLNLLKSAGTDIHEFTDRANGFSEADMQRLYDAGFTDGQNAVVTRKFGSGEFHNVDGTPNWFEIARYCQQQTARLRGDKERDFVNDMAARTLYRPPTPAQEKWLCSIFFRLGGVIQPPKEKS